MAKEKYERTKPHVNVGTIGHVDMVRQPLQPLSQPFFPRSSAVKPKPTTRSTQLLKKKLAVLRLTPLTSNTKPNTVTTHTLTARAMLTTSRT